VFTLHKHLGEHTLGGILFGTVLKLNVVDGRSSSDNTIDNNEVLIIESLPLNYALTFMHFMNGLDSRMYS
jgi:hypothetical protein